MLNMDGNIPAHLEEQSPRVSQRAAQYTEYGQELVGKRLSTAVWISQDTRSDIYFIAKYSRESVVSRVPASQINH